MNMLKRKSDAADYASHDFDQAIHNSNRQLKSIINEFTASYH